MKNKNQTDYLGLTKQWWLAGYIAILATAGVIFYSELRFSSVDQFGQGMLIVAIYLTFVAAPALFIFPYLFSKERLFTLVSRLVWLAWFVASIYLVFLFVGTKDKDAQKDVISALLAQAPCILPTVKLRLMSGLRGLPEHKRRTLQVV